MNIRKTILSHSNFKKGLTDYHDGENLEVESDSRLDGKVAEGNEFLEDDLAENTQESEKEKKDALDNQQINFE